MQNTTTLNLQAMQELKDLLLKTFPHEIENVIVFGLENDKLTLDIINSLFMERNR